MTFEEIIFELRKSQALAIDQLKALEAERAEETREHLELLEYAWGVIANAHKGNWNAATSEWHEAAAKWRDQWAALTNNLAHAVCLCGHVRARHVGCERHTECCDETPCECDAFVKARRVG